MIEERIGDMTKQELEALILRTVAGHYQHYPYIQKSERPIEEVLASIRRNIIQPKPGEPSTLELLREDRSR
jgi:hypothetical protein